IRTPANGVRVRCATVTQIPCILQRLSKGIYYYTHFAPNVKKYFSFCEVFSGGGATPEKTLGGRDRRSGSRGNMDSVFGVLAVLAVGHHHAAAGFGAGGMGRDVGVILERRMDHMALVGVHGLQG